MNINWAKMPVSQHSLLRAILANYFPEEAPVLVQVELEGHGMSDDGRFILGCRAGPSYSIEYLLHEMAHLAEREVDKLLLRPHFAWGFHMGEFFQCGPYSGWQSTNDKPVRREMRVWAYQYHLLRRYGLPMDMKTLTRSVVYLDAWCFYRLYQDEEKSVVRPTKERLDLLAEETLQLSREYTLERFERAWWERMKALSCTPVK